MPVVARAHACYARGDPRERHGDWRRALVALRARTLDMNVLMTIAVIGAAAIGEWAEAATVIWLFALGGAARVALARAYAALDPRAHGPRRRRGALVRARHGLAEVRGLPRSRVGDVIVVRPGERVALDGRDRRAPPRSTSRRSPGSRCRSRRRDGDAVYAGSLNTTGHARGARHGARRGLDARAHRLPRRGGAGEPGARAAPRRPLHALLHAGRRGACRRRSRSCRRSLARVLGVPGLGRSPSGSTARSSCSWSSCPCALVISTPVAIVSAITRAARDGVLVKGGAFLELAGRGAGGRVRQDRHAHVRPSRGRRGGRARRRSSRDEVLGLAAALEARSTHPRGPGGRRARRRSRALGDGGRASFRDVAGRGVSA